MRERIFIKDYSFLTGEKQLISNSESRYAYFIPESVNEELKLIEQNNKAFKGVDRSVLFLLYLVDQLKAKVNPNGLGINVGSSRGATGLWEENHSKFIGQEQINIKSSPLTTSGNLSSWLAQYLKTDAVSSSFSITCSSFHHAMLNAVAWLKAGMTERFLVGASEASNTPFTFEQLDVLGIYSKEGTCRPFDFDDPSGLLLGEGAGLFLLDKNEKGALAELVGWGMSMEQIKSATAMNKSGLGYEKSMLSAMHMADLEEVDLIVAHAPGTRMGDRAEYTAIKKLLGAEQYVQSVKGMWGHSLGASGAQSMAYALNILQGKNFNSNVATLGQPKSKAIRTVLINAAGFGGNVVSIILKVI
jgi:3-oxoacyl-[acyl-carrier-protein] synthase II